MCVCVCECVSVCEFVSLRGWFVDVGTYLHKVDRSGTEENNNFETLYYTSN